MVLGGKKIFRPRPNWTLHSHTNSHRITRPMPRMRALLSLVRPECFNRKILFSISSAFGLPWHNESSDAPLSGAPISVLLIGDLYCFVTCFFLEDLWNELHQQADAEQRRGAVGSRFQF